MTARITFSEIPEELVSTLLHTEAYIKNSGLDYKLTELIRLRVSMINQCAYCTDMHFKEATVAGEDIQRLFLLSSWRDVNLYSETERACLAWAESLTMKSIHTDQQKDFEILSKHFSKKQIADLSLVVTQITSWNMLMKAFAIEGGSYQVSKN